MDQPPAVAFTEFADVWSRATEREVGAALCAIGAGRTLTFLIISQASENASTLYIVLRFKVTVLDFLSILYWFIDKVYCVVKITLFFSLKIITALKLVLPMNKHHIEYSITPITGAVQPISGQPHLHP